MVEEKRHFGCAGQVLIKINEELSIPDFRSHLKAAVGLAGGVGHRGSMCGAIIGGIMALWIVLGPDGTEDPDVFNKKSTRLFEREAKTLIEEFERKFGSVACEELIGVSVWTEEGYEKYEELKAAGKLKCHDYMDYCSNLTCKLLRR